MVKLDHLISLIDSPGVVLNAVREGEEVSDNVALRNCLRIEQIEDPVSIAYLIIKKLTKTQLIQIYNLNEAESRFEDAQQLLYLLGMKMGKLLRGGVPDLETMSKILIKDWNDGKIRYQNEPPEIETSGGNNSSALIQQIRNEMVDGGSSCSSSSSGGNGTTDSVELVSEWSKEFDINALSKPLVEGREEEEEEDDEMNDVGGTSSSKNKNHQIGSREVINESWLLNHQKSTAQLEQEHAQEKEKGIQKQVVTRPREEQQGEGEGRGVHSAGSNQSSSSSSTSKLLHSLPQLNKKLQEEIKKHKKKMKKEARKAKESDMNDEGGSGGEMNDEDSGDDEERIEDD